jgi:hypothetical protein
MDRRLKWLSYTLLAIVTLVVLLMIAFGTYVYVNHIDKSGIIVVIVGIVCILIEIGSLLLYFRRVKTR